MPIQKSQAHLRGGDNGSPPDSQPRFGPVLAHAWHDKYVADGNDYRAMANPDSLVRGSDAGGCARDLGYRIEDRLLIQANNAKVAELIANNVSGADLDEAIAALPEPKGNSNPPSLADTFRMGIGSMVHEAIQEVLPAAFPGSEVEVTVVREMDPALSMHLDVLIAEPIHVKGDDVPLQTKRIAIEIKTINGFGYKSSATTFNGPPEGPRDNAVLQGALAAYELDADELVVLYLSLELLSPSIAKKAGMDEIGRFCAEWTYPREVYRPLAEAEHTRLNTIIDVVKAGELPPRAIPAKDLPRGHRVIDPASGAWELTDDSGAIVNLGNTWHCGYCWNRDRCLQDGPS